MKWDPCPRSAFKCQDSCPLSKRWLQWDRQFSKGQICQSKSDCPMLSGNPQCAFIACLCCVWPSLVKCVHLNQLVQNQLSRLETRKPLARSYRKPSWKPYTDLSSGEIHQGLCSTIFHLREDIFSHMAWGYIVFQRIPQEICIRWQANWFPHLTTTSEVRRVGVMMLFD